MGINTFWNKLASLTGDTTITSAANLDYLRYVSSTSKWTNTPPVGAEVASTPVAGANDTTLGTTNRYYSFVTMPSTAPLWLLTAIEWLNGTAVAGSIIAHVEKVDANPPVANGCILVTHSFNNTQTGTSAVQRVSLKSAIVAAGEVLGLSIVAGNAGAKCGTTTVAAGNRIKAIANTGDPVNAQVTAWGSATEEPYIKLYYKPVFGV